MGKLKTTSKVETLSFEEALEQLEAIVERMENDSLPLETLLTCHEQGIALQQACQKKLEAASQRMQQLEESAEGALHIQPVVMDESSPESPH